ncbi:hypothetical protein FRC05_005409 [Tulasnella sp. 425]|nr:hypothetical protein FRC05_005409 [Tulasnella sp. 425]
MLTSPAPLLDELKVERTDMDLGPFPVPAAPPAEAFCGHAPSLKKLDIGRGFHSLINSFKFSGLSSLSILSEETLAMDKIIDMLAESPGMSSLTIVEGRTDRGFNPFLTNGQANDADHNRNPQHTVLRKLTLRLEGTDRVLYLLEHVQAPSCTQLDLRHGTADPPLHFVRRSLDPFLPAFQQARASMVSISIDLGRFSRFGCEENGPSVSIQTSGDTSQSQLHVTSLLDWVIEVLGDQSPDGAEVTLRLKEQGFRLDCSLPAVFTRLHRLPTITALFLDGATSRQDWILKLMGTDWPTSDINPQFFLPCLIFIYLSGFDSPGKDLVEVLEARYGKSLPQDERRLPQLPPPLKFLKFGELNYHRTEYLD